MSELYGHAIGVMIVLMMITFLGIWVWAWLPYHKKTFASLAKIPMEDVSSISHKEEHVS